MSVHNENIKKITVNTLMEMKAKGEKISMLTAYDYSMASIIDQAGMDVILVGDSAANVMCGHSSTLPMTLDQMIYHAQCVVRGVKRAHVIVDLPFGSYESSEEKAVESAVRVIKESGADSLKIEGGKEVIGSIRKIIHAGIPVMGHLGLMPQSINIYGTYGLRGKDENEAAKLINDAKLLQEAGCYALLLEKIPATLAAKVTEGLTIPTIGIGAGSATDGQVLVMHDILGINKGFSPKFLRKYANLFDDISNAVKSYINDVKEKSFPNENEQY
jgi:3-methyl-2-oxobutanoate hydroxymethyltransferase